MMGKISIKSVILLETIKMSTLKRLFYGGYLKMELLITNKLTPNNQ